MPASNLPTAVKMLKEFRSADTLDGAEVVQLYHVYNLPFGVWDLAYNYVPAKGVVHPNPVYHGAIVTGRFIVKRWTDQQQLSHAFMRVVYSNNRHYNGGPRRSGREDVEHREVEVPVWYRVTVTGQAPIWRPAVVMRTRQVTIRVETRYVSGDSVTMSIVRSRVAGFTGYYFPMDGYFYQFKGAKIDEDGNAGNARVEYAFELRGPMQGQTAARTEPYHSHLAVPALDPNQEWSRDIPDDPTQAPPPIVAVPSQSTGWFIPNNLLNSLFNLYPV